MTRCPPRVKCRGVIPALSHIMLQSDTLANEFNEILNAVEIFAPFQPLDPAITFYAPLRNNVRDLRLNQDNFQRASDAWHKDGSGIYRNVAINQARFEENRLFLEAAQTNKMETYNAAPDGKVGWDGYHGGAGASHTEVNSVQALQASGLSNICPSGRVNRFENTVGALRWVVTLQSTPGNTNLHTASVYARAISGAPYLKIQNGPGRVNIGIHSDFRRYVITESPIDDTRRWILASDGPAICEFILEQYEESPVVTSPIVTEGTAGQRAVDRLHWNAPNAFNAPQGMCIFQWVPRWSGSDYPSGARRDTTLVTLRDTTPGLSGLCRVTHFTNNNISLETYDDVTVVGLNIAAPDLVADQLYTIAVRWNDSPAQKQIGIRLASGWDWSVTGSYAGSYIDDGIIRVSDDPLYGQKMSSLELWNEDRGTAWIEANYP